MSILASIAVGSEVDVLGTGLQASESCIAIGLEDGSLYTFNAQGQPVGTYSADDWDGAGSHSVFRAFSIIGDKLVIESGKKRCLEVVDVMTSKTLTSIGISEQPKKIISYHDGDLDYIIASPHGAYIQLAILSSEGSVVETFVAIPDMPSFRIFKYYMAQAILALLGVSEGIVQLWQLGALTDSDTRLVTNLCTIYSTADSPDPGLPSPGESENSDKKSCVHKIYAILLHSSGRVVTGHDDGKIKVWDYNSMLSDDMTLSEQSDHRSGKTITEPICTIQNSTLKPNLVNGLLEYCYQGDLKSSSYDVVSTDTGGFARLWRFLEGDSSGNGLRLSLVGEHKLFDHSFICRAISSKGWLVAGGKEGENENKDACGLNGQLKMLNLASLVDDGLYSSVEVKTLVLQVW